MYLLPKLRDWIKVRQIRIPLQAEVFRTHRRVPVMATVLPRQLSGEGCEEVVEGPGQDHVVVAVEEEHDDAGCQTNSWRQGGGER